MIGVFDSGVGGLSIFQALAQAISGRDITYIADTKNFPYGEKTLDQLQAITHRIVHFLVEQKGATIIVIACNTATVSSLDYLRLQFSIPIIGVVPVVKPACEKTKTKKIAILASTITASSDYQKKLIAQFGTGIEVYSIGCQDLVQLVERGEIDSQQTKQALEHYLNPLITFGVDVIGLGCTHFVFLRDQIKKLIPEHVTIMDSTDPVVKQVLRVLEKQGNTLPQAHAPVYKLYSTSDVEKFEQSVRQLLGDFWGNKGVQELSI